MLLLYLARTSVYFEPIVIIAVLFIVRICRYGIHRVEVRANPSAFYSFLFISFNKLCTFKQQKNPQQYKTEINKMEDRKAMQLFCLRR